MVSCLVLIRYFLKKEIVVHFQELYENVWLIGKGCRDDGIIVHSIIPSIPRCFERSSFY